MDFYRDMGAREGMCETTLRKMLKNLRVSTDVYEVRYYKNTQNKMSRKYFLNNEEIQGDHVNKHIKAQFKKMELGSSILKRERF